MTTEKRQCEYKISGRWSGYTRCYHNAKVERDGHHYCGVHDPVRVAEKLAVRNAKWQAEWDANDARAKAARERENLIDQLVSDAAGDTATREQLRELARLILESK